MRQIILDTETTGLSHQDGDRILEIGCVEMVNRQLTGNDRHYYINPERESHPDALRVHGITSEFLKDKPLFKDIAQEFFDYLQGAELIIHNAPFDLGFINNEFRLLSMPSIEESGIPVIDSLLLAKELFPGKRNSLDALCERLEVDNSNRVLHGALLDAQLLADVFINLTRGQHDLLAADGTEEAAQGLQHQNVQVDLVSLSLPIIECTAEELSQHEKVMAEIDKEAGGQAIWNR